MNDRQVTDFKQRLEQMDTGWVNIKPADVLELIAERCALTVEVARLRRLAEREIACPQCGSHEVYEVKLLTPIQLYCDNCGSNWPYVSEADAAPADGRTIDGG